MEVAGCVFGSVSLAIQLVDTVEALRAFWTSIQDGPRQVATIIEDLEHLKDLLKDRATSLETPSKSLLDVIRRCNNKIAPLERIVEELEPGFKSRHKLVRFWSAYRTAKRAEQIERFQNALHDAKADILLVKQEISERYQSKQFESLNYILSSFTIQHSESMAATASSELIRDKKLAHMEQSIAELKSHILEMKDLLPTWADGLRSSPVSMAMNTLVRKATQKTLEPGEMKDIIQKFVETKLDSTSPTNHNLVMKITQREGVKGKAGKHRRARAAVTRLNQYCETEYRTKYSTMLGTIYYRTRVLRTLAEYHQYAEADQRELETSWTIVPSLWFVTTGLNFLVAKSTSGWKHQIQHFPTVRHDSLMFKHCIEGNESGVRQLLREKAASPNLCDEHGFTALHRAASRRHVNICKLLLQNGANANFASFSTGETPLHHLPVNRSRVRCTDLLETIQVLVEYGRADPFLENANGQNALQVFENFFKWPSRIALREEITKGLSWLQTSADEPTQEEPAKGRLFNTINVDAEVESLDLLLKPDSDLRDAFSPQNCPGSYVRGWTVLHVLMHLRVEPVWHPSSVTDILQQKPLWTAAMARILQQGFEPHAVDWEGDTPSSLAIRSLFTFHVWQNALATQGVSLYEFARQELAVSPNLVCDGWTVESLYLLFLAPTEDLYLHNAEWRERPKLFAFKNDEFDGLYMQCCWFQLLDVLKHRSILPRGWQVLTAPRQFYRPREYFYRHTTTGVLHRDRPIGGQEFNITSLSYSVAAQGKRLVDELSKLGVVWQG